MNRYTTAIVVGVGVSLASVFSPSLAGSRITYVPPRQEKQRPQETQSGANRGCRQDLTNAVTLIAPSNHVGLTAASHPILFYYLARKVDVPAKITLAAVDGREAILEKPISLEQLGINSFKIPQEVSLNLNQEYLWTITLVCNSKRPSENVEVQATLKRVMLPAELERQLAWVTSPLERSQLYARYSLWYDTLASVASSGSQEARQDFQDLMTQIGLNESIRHPLARN